MLHIKKSSHKGSWLDRKGTVTQFHFDRSQTGRRVAFHVWADTPHLVDITVLKGSFWRGDGTEKVFFQLKGAPVPTGSYIHLAETLADMFLKDR
jgi:hypothetical protein